MNENPYQLPVYLTIKLSNERLHRFCIHISEYGEEFREYAETLRETAEKLDTLELRLNGSPSNSAITEAAAEALEIAEKLNAVSVPGIMGLSEEQVTFGEKALLNTELEHITSIMKELLTNSSSVPAIEFENEACLLPTSFLNMLRDNIYYICTPLETDERNIEESTILRDASYELEKSMGGGLADALKEAIKRAKGSEIEEKPDTPHEELTLKKIGKRAEPLLLQTLDAAFNGKDQLKRQAANPIKRTRISYDMDSLVNLVEACVQMFEMHKIPMHQCRDQLKSIRQNQL